MSFVVRVEAAAAMEIEHAFEWYESRHTGLGAEFLRAVAVACDLLEREPQRFPVTRVPYRWVKLRKFPYALHFQFNHETVSVLACLHFRQNPARWPAT